MNKDEAGGKWSPLISASINAAKTAFGVTNPLLGGAMTIGGMLLTSPKARDLAVEGLKLGWSGAKLAGKGMKWLATRVGDGVIQVFKKKKQKPKEEKKEEPIQQRPLDDSGTNIPNIFIPQESQTEYMKRMTGGMDTGPANANVPTYSGYRKPQYEKVQNRVMLAPPKVSKKTVRVKVKRRKAK